MKIEKTYTGTLNIGKEKVSLDTNIIYQGIQLEYVGTINITSLLPSNYIVSNGNNKIIIAKLTKDSDNFLDLFKYKGLAIISKCMLVTEDLKKHILYINKSNIDTYGMLDNSWDNLTRNYEDLEFDGNNNKKRYLFKRRIKDEDTGIVTETREIRKK
tara:strand:- start:1371 stop:1841 length:471 start_codon:yes stop_codon:yes gene_type:complete